jgi:NAD(P)-dependent dehydrogenase (short-subunit alcohol dehydrogenase family)
MDLHLSGKSALITGASKGIGFGIAQALAAEGCNLHLVARNGVELEKAQAALRAAHPGVAVDIHSMDMSRADAAQTLLKHCRHVDILINNAGGIPNGAIDAVDEATWRRAWDIKVFGYINMTRAFLAEMRERRVGVIINIVGAAAERVKVGYVAGSTGNAALMAFSRAVGSDSLDYGVRVLAINPGLIKTERLQMRFEQMAKTELGDSTRWREIMARVPQVGEPSDIGDMAAFLASDRARFITGVAITVDGGAVARTPL